VDAEVWEEAKVMAQDSEKVRRMVNKRRGDGQEALDEAQRDLHWTEQQIAEAEKKKARLMRDMEEEEDDTMRRDMRARIVELNDSLTGLQARREEGAKRAANLDAWVNRYDETLRRIFKVPAGTDTKVWLVGDKYTIVMFNPAPETLDSLSYEDKRRVLEVLGCHVDMYPTNSEFYRTHGKRWNILWNPEGDICVHTSSVEEPAAVTAAIEEFLESL
jgi:hypothetical protein